MKWVIKLRGRSLLYWLSLVLAVVASAGTSAGDCPDCRVPISRIATPKIPPYCVEVSTPHGTCSGTVIASTNKSSLVVTCNHCFGKQAKPGGPFLRGNYPVNCSVRSLSSGKVFDAIAVDGSPDPDFALVLLSVGWEACPLDVAGHRRGDNVQHYGRSSGYSQGTILRFDTGCSAASDLSERSTLRSIPGDSGAGVLSGTGLVAVLWGYWGDGTQGGTSIGCILPAIRKSKAVPADLLATIKEVGK